ncbi:MAG: hypothetical protein ACRC3A_07370 [Culicoidibacterales bacterium]
MKKWAMMKFLESQYENHTIRVESDWDQEILYVDGEIQDEQKENTSWAKLTVKLLSGEDIKVNIDGT